MQGFLSHILPLVKYCFKGEFIYSFCVSPVCLLKITGCMEWVDGESYDQITLLIKLETRNAPMPACCSVPVSSYGWGRDLLSSVSKGTLIKPNAVAGWCGSHARSWWNCWVVKGLLQRHTLQLKHTQLPFLAGGPHQACREKVIMCLLEWLLECPEFEEPSQTKTAFSLGKLKRCLTIVSSWRPAPRCKITETVSSSAGMSRCFKLCIK